MYSVYVMNGHEGYTLKSAVVAEPFHAVRIAQALWMGYGQRNEVRITNAMDELVWTSDELPAIPANIDAVNTGA